MADELTGHCGDEATRNGLVEPFQSVFRKLAAFSIYLKSSL